MSKKLTFEKYFYAIALFVYGVAAFFGVGYFNADEHYQIIEFADYLSGKNLPESLPWEFQEKIRPTLQPVITYFIFKICDFLSIVDPYSKAFVLRLITVFFSVTTIYYFSKTCIKYFKLKYVKVFLFLSYFLWFLPLVNVRFSSEVWSGLFFLWAIILVLNIKTLHKHYLLLGFLLGFSFLFRYQIGFAISGLFFWLYFVKKENFKKIFIFFLSITSIVILGFLIDSWFYNDWVFTPYHYFRVNILESKASEFGVSPWYYYFLFISFFSFVPIGLILLFSSFHFFWMKPKNVITWAIIPFLLGHMLVPHKELRFLFPILNFVPIIIIISFEYFANKLWSIRYKKAFVILFSLLFLMNSLLLYFANTRAAGNGRGGIVVEIHKLNDKENINIFVTDDYYPKYLWTLNANFYKQHNATFINIENPNFSFADVNQNNSKNVLIISVDDKKDKKISEFINRMNLKQRNTTFPTFLFPLFEKYSYGNKVFILYSE